MKHRLFSRFLACFSLFSATAATVALPVSAKGLPIPLPENVLSVWDAVRSIFAVRELADVNAMFANATLPFLICFFIGALLFALWGYHLSRALFIGGGFVGGWMLGSAIYDPIVGTGIFGGALPPYVRYIVYVVLGIVVSCLVIKILRAGIFLAAAISTYFFLSGFSLFEMLVDSVFAGEFAYKYLICRLLVAALVGALALAIEKPVMILMTAAAGGMLSAVALSVALGFGDNVTAETVIGIVFTVVGVISQFRVGHKRHRAENRT